MICENCKYRYGELIDSGPGYKLVEPACRYEEEPTTDEDGEEQCEHYEVKDYEID